MAMEEFVINNKNTGECKIKSYAVQMRSHKIGKFYEEEMLNRIAELKPWTILDVGANIGNHAVFFSKVAKHVYAFEPLQEYMDVLFENLDENDCDNVTVYGFALSDKEATYSNKQITLYEDENGETTSRLLDNVYNNGWVSDSGKVVMKIDCEGMDLDVIKGGVNYIKACTPDIFIEGKNPEDKQRFIDFLKPL